MATQHPLHRASIRYKLSMHHQLNHLPICTKPSVAQYPPNIQSRCSLQYFGFVLTLKQSQLIKLQTLTALKTKLQYTTAMVIDADTHIDVYQFNGTYGIDIITDKDGQGFVTIDNNPANSGTFKLENIYKNEGTGYTFTQVNGGSTLIISKEGDANRVIINDWSAGDLSINLSGSEPTAPQTTLSGDFKTSISHFKTLNTPPLDSSIPVQACKPIFMRVASLLLFNLNAHKTAANDATYNNTIERKAA